MKIGIHETNGFFSDRWIAYCKANDISYKLVDCYSTNVMRQLSDCDALMWHFNHKSPKASKFAKQLLFSVQASGKKVFPDFNTVWHFDDKVGQKYLLEAIGAPSAPAYVFYSKQEALEWANQTSYPKVFKLRNGAGSDNVRLVKSKKKATHLINKAFRRGFKQYQAWDNLKERFRKYRLGKTILWDVVKGIIRLAHTTEYSRVAGREIGYIYFQDFIPDNDHDIRIVVVGEKAFAIKRMVRVNDFRASGSGNILYDRQLFDEKTIKLSFDLAEKLQIQCVAFDFVHDNTNMLLVEISYGFSPNGYDPCPGYWEKDLTWREGKFNPYGWMVENLIKSVKEERKA
jgi:glutathione synthase/RimK-type ligase-like ATP-grasp enzyme